MDIRLSARPATFSQFRKNNEVCEEMIVLVTLPDHSTWAEKCNTVVNKLST